MQLPIPIKQITKLTSRTACATLSWVMLAHPVAAQTTIPTNEVVMSRYTTTSGTPDDSVTNPLAAIAQLQFPRKGVQSVGDAVRYLLLRTGYVLIDADKLDPIVAAVLQRPLPESHRELGPYRVDALLNILLGKAFVLHIDALTRTISYTPAEQEQQSISRNP